MTYKKLMEKSAGAVVIHPLEKQILMIKSNVGRGGWGFPKGHIEEEEDCISAAKRETTEETGLQSLIFIRELETIKQVIRYPKSQEIAHRETTFFLFQSSSCDIGELAPDGQHTKVMWVYFADLGNIKLRYKYVLNLALKVTALYL